MTRGAGPGVQVFPTHERITLGNGVRVLATRLPHLHTASLVLLVRAGSRYESPETNGLSHFLEHMLFRGTNAHPSAFALNLAIEELGATLAAATYVDHTMFGINLPPESLTDGLALVGEIMRTPRFDGIDVEKRIVAEEALEGIDEDGVNVDADDVVRDLSFAPDPLGYKIIGSAENIERFGIADLRAHMDRHYVGRNMVLAVAGAVDPVLLFEAAGDALGSLPAGARMAARPPAQASSGPRLRCVYSRGSQNDLRVSFPTFGVRDPRWTALQMLSRVLDDGLSARLQRRVCDEKGLAYNVSAGIDPYEDCGVFDLCAASAHDKTPALLTELLALASELSAEAPAESELAKVRQRYAWELRAMQDSADAMAGLAGVGEIFDRNDALEVLAARAASVSREDVLRVAREVFCRDAMAVVCVGSLNEAQQAALGRIADGYR